MAKRFSMREMGLLMAPVVLIGAVGWWISKRPTPPADDGKLRLTLQIDKPTTLEAFDGAHGVFVLGLKQRNEQFRINGSVTFLELQTARDPVVLRQGVERKNWGKVWHGNINGKRFPVRISEVPPGVLSFGCKCSIDYSSIKMGAPLPPKPLPLSAKWKIDRTRLKALNLASWPRKPLVTLVEVKIARINSGPAYGGRQIVGEAIFRFDGATMSDKTPLEMKVSSSSTATVGWSPGAGWSTTPEKPRHRITEWTVDSLKTQNPIIRITGRVSADNRWPLGFQIEPFNFQTVKVGQKLPFKQFPVALPKP